MKRDILKLSRKGKSRERGAEMEIRKFKMVARATKKELRHEVSIHDEGFGIYSGYVNADGKSTFILSRVSESDAIASMKKWAEGFCTVCDLVEA